MALLLVSVRSVAEAETALAGGADIIDIKEPSRGSLGRANDATILAIAEHVGGQARLSAALGEFLDSPNPPPDSFFGFVKVGLAGCVRHIDWPHHVSRLFPGARPGTESGDEGKIIQCPHLVPVAYADWTRADAPAPTGVLDFAINRNCAALLIDTYRKDGQSLPSWLTGHELAAIRRKCADAKLPLALAGSLTAADIKRLLPLEPDIIAVRGAACLAGVREGLIHRESVQQLKRLLG